VAWVTDLMAAGSLATGDYLPGVSDLYLVALTTGPVGPARQELLASLHRDLGHEIAQGLDLGCVYADVNSLTDLRALHPTWTHGLLVHLILSGITRADARRTVATAGCRVRGRRLPPGVLPHAALSRCGGRRSFTAIAAR
jgi:hypothetical protein